MPVTRRPVLSKVGRASLPRRGPGPPSVLARQALVLVGSEQRAVRPLKIGVEPGPVPAFIEPRLEDLCELGVDWDFADSFERRRSCVDLHE